VLKLAAVTVAAAGWSTSVDAQNITEFSVPTASSEPQAIVSGPDGALWFTENNSAKIGRVTTAGAIAEFLLPESQLATSITAGADGALWFTEGSNRIGRITTNGAVTEFTLPTSTLFPTSIVPGPDGALWFTEFGTDASGVGRITTSGVITQFPLPTGVTRPPTVGSSPNAITVGPDGALWFIAIDIGRITRPATWLPSSPFRST